MSRFFEMHQHWHELPMIRCPHCGCPIQWDNYYDIEPGHNRECYKCDKPIWVAEAYTALHVRLSRENELD